MTFLAATAEEKKYGSAMKRVNTHRQSKLFTLWMLSHFRSHNDRREKDKNDRFNIV